ncbi:hypothetical protein, variant [Capsaspora owczarzaki ATCC 30864]|uniref:Importin N-terminal domain-containing protein n=1 Tax=Capsaspora owczarzaki (strain ATCC 30864) TaxID=595528 RepID=A0A0D2WM41_CAPO3|nr:hypothetical protein, variant [Capsaspora owczarzaki ATCC 30864]
MDGAALALVDAEFRAALEIAFSGGALRNRVAHTSSSASPAPLAGLGPQQAAGSSAMELERALGYLAQFQANDAAWSSCVSLLQAYAPHFLQILAAVVDSASSASSASAAQPSSVSAALARLRSINMGVEAYMCVTAAQMLKNKVRLQAAGIAPDALNMITQNLAQLVGLYRNGPSTVRTQLLVALADCAIASGNVTAVLESLLRDFGSDMLQDSFLQTIETAGFLVDPVYIAQQRLGSLDESVSTALLDQLLSAPCMVDLLIKIAEEASPMNTALPDHVRSAATEALTVAFPEVMVLLGKTASLGTLALAISAAVASQPAESIMPTPLAATLGSIVRSLSVGGELATATLTCLRLWLQLCKLPSPYTLDQSLFTAFPAFAFPFAILQQHPELLDPASDTIKALCSATSHVARYRPWVAELLPRILRLVDLYRESVAEDDGDMSNAVIRILAGAADSYIDMLSSIATYTGSVANQPDSSVVAVDEIGDVLEEWQFASATALVDAVLECSFHPDSEAASLTFAFWHQLADAVSSRADRLLLPRLGFLLTSLVSHMASADPLVEEDDSVDPASAMEKRAVGTARELLDPSSSFREFRIDAQDLMSFVTRSVVDADTCCLHLMHLLAQHVDATFLLDDASRASHSGQNEPAQLVPSITSSSAFSVQLLLAATSTPVPYSSPFATSDAGRPILLAGCSWVEAALYGLAGLAPHLSFKRNPVPLDSLVQSCVALLNNVQSVGAAGVDVALYTTILRLFAALKTWIARNLPDELLAGLMQTLIRFVLQRENSVVTSLAANCIAKISIGCSEQKRSLLSFVEVLMQVIDSTEITMAMDPRSVVQLVKAVISVAAAGQGSAAGNNELCSQLFASISSAIIGQIAQHPILTGDVRSTRLIGRRTQRQQQQRHQQAHNRIPNNSVVVLDDDDDDDENGSLSHVQEATTKGAGIDDQQAPSHEDMAVLLSRLKAVFKESAPVSSTLLSSASHPCIPVLTESWPLLLQIIHVALPSLSENRRVVTAAFGTQLVSSSLLSITAAEKLVTKACRCLIAALKALQARRLLFVSVIARKLAEVLANPLQASLLEAQQQFGDALNPIAAQMLASHLWCPMDCVLDLVMELVATVPSFTDALVDPGMMSEGPTELLDALASLVDRVVHIVASIPRVGDAAMLSDAQAVIKTLRLVTRCILDSRLCVYVLCSGVVEGVAQFNALLAAIRLGFAALAVDDRQLTLEVLQFVGPLLDLVQIAVDSQYGTQSSMLKQSSSSLISPSVMIAVANQMASLMAAAGNVCQVVVSPTIANSVASDSSQLSTLGLLVTTLLHGLIQASRWRVEHTGLVTEALFKCARLDKALVLQLAQAHVATMLEQQQQEQSQHAGSLGGASQVAAITDAAIATLTR